MHLLLTDRLTCPRCGPTFGLILRADRLTDRQVHEGALGCPNCRDRFSVRDGFADLRAPPRGELPDGLAGVPERGGDGPAWPEPTHEIERTRALLGLVRGPGTVALVGAPARWGAALARAVEDLEVVALDPDLAGWPDAARVSRGVSGPGLAFFSGMMRGVVLDGRLGRRLLSEAARVVAPKCRVLVDAAPEPSVVEAALAEAGLDVVVSERGTVVAARA